MNKLKIKQFHKEIKQYNWGFPWNDIDKYNEPLELEELERWGKK